MTRQVSADRLPIDRVVRLADAVVRTVLLLGLTAAFATPTIMATGTAYIWVGTNFVWGQAPTAVTFVYSAVGFVLFVAVYILLYNVEKLLGGALLGTTGRPAYEA